MNYSANGERPTASGDRGLPRFPGSSLFAEHQPKPIFHGKPQPVIATLCEPGAKVLHQLASLERHGASFHVASPLAGF